MLPIKIDKMGSAVKMIAHRGMSCIETENTCAAFVAAGNRETFFGIETDVHRTADGQYVIFHDDNTARMTGENIVIEQTDMATLRALRLSDVGTREKRGDLIMPTLQEYISICKKYGKVAVLELKNPMNEETVCEIMEIIAQMEYQDHLLVISFALDNLIYLRKHFPEVPAQFLLSKWDEKWLDVLKEYDLGLDIKFTAVTQELVEKIHSIGQQINCWTLGTPEQAAQLIAWGVDYITTDNLE